MVAKEAQQVYDEIVAYITRSTAECTRNGIVVLHLIGQTDYLVNIECPIKITNGG